MELSDALAPAVFFTDHKGEVEKYLTEKSWIRSGAFLLRREALAVGEACAQGGFSVVKLAATTLSALDAVVSSCLRSAQNQTGESKFSRTARLLQESGSHLLSAISAIVFLVANLFTSLFASSYCLPLSEALIWAEEIEPEEEESPPYWTVEDIKYASKYWTLSKGKPVLLTQEIEGPTPSLEADIATGLETCYLNPSATSRTEKKCGKVWRKFLLELYDSAKRTIEEERSPSPTFEGKRLSREFLVRFCERDLLENLYNAGAQKVDVFQLLHFFHKLRKRLPRKNQSDLPDRNTNPIKDNWYMYIYEKTVDHYTGYIDLQSVVLDKPLRPAQAQIT